MGDAVFNRLVADIQARGEILESDMLPLRRSAAADMQISVVEADQLFLLNQLENKPDSWSDYFVNVITTFLIYQTPPEGYINSINASWLIARIQFDGVVETHTELALLLNVLKVAKNVTDALEIFAIEQVKRAVMDGEGYLAKGRELKTGVMGAAEVEILRTVLYSVAGEGGVGISNTEANLLFDLNDACEDADNHPSWQKLFINAITNHLMMVAAWEEPDLQEALRQHEFWNDNEVQKVNWVSALRNTGKQFNPSSFMKNLALIREHANEEYEFSHMNKANVGDAERITDQEAQWLIARLNRDGRLGRNERALLQFLKEECPDIHDSLMPMINAA